jgi:hypothetical protein
MCDNPREPDIVDYLTIFAHNEDYPDIPPEGYSDDFPDDWDKSDWENVADVSDKTGVPTAMDKLVTSDI